MEMEAAKRNKDDHVVSNPVLAERVEVGEKKEETINFVLVTHYLVTPMNLQMTQLNYKLPPPYYKEFSSDSLLGENEGGRRGKGVPRTKTELPRVKKIHQPKEKGKVKKTRTKRSKDADGHGVGLSFQHS
ncbi:hypothetical protein PIB30_011779 [Stylosanthes scabra]|uniref:Uncharacterized protein n=1 Tax=Stylosanthes scabra TaxID=79078 RepID=A0ABU6R654_9FABA|nr:hypothetical protein [Stylosanthes scabra]